MAELKKVIVMPNGTYNFEVYEDYTYKGFTVPAGYITDGASVPRIFWSIFPPYKPEYFTAVIVHDYLCEQARYLHEFLEADDVLLEMLGDLRIDRLQKFILYYSCRWYHKIRYRKYKDKPLKKKGEE